MSLYAKSQYANKVPTIAESWERDAQIDAEPLIPPPLRWVLGVAVVALAAVVVAGVVALW